MSAASRRRYALAAASFGPEWAPQSGRFARSLLAAARRPRDRDRWAAHLRRARRELAAIEDAVR